MTTAAEIAAVLETSGGNVWVRASKLRILPVCGRCLGSGNYSFNMVNGSTCFGCSGSGTRVPTEAELDGVLEAAKETKVNGKFAEYMAHLANVKATKNAANKTMAAWKATGVSSHYDWRKAAEFSRNPTDENRIHRDIADINKKMCDAFDSVQKAEGPKNAEGYAALAVTLDAALEAIAAAKVELDTYLGA